MTTPHQYFADHPESREGVWKAFFAYHAGHFRTEPQGHYFTSGDRESCCVWCGRSRSMVRWDELPPYCGKRPPMVTIESVIMDEEFHAGTLNDRSMSIVVRQVARHGASGKTLALLHSTYGIDPETSMDCAEFPLNALAEYQAEMEKERILSRSKQVKEMIQAR